MLGRQRPGRPAGVRLPARVRSFVPSQVRLISVAGPPGAKTHARRSIERRVWVFAICSQQKPLSILTGETIRHREDNLRQHGRNLYQILGEPMVPAGRPDASTVRIPTHRRLRTRHPRRDERRGSRSHFVFTRIDNESSRQPPGTDIGIVGGRKQALYHGVPARPDLPTHRAAVDLSTRDVCRRVPSGHRPLCFRPQSFEKDREDLETPLKKISRGFTRIKKNNFYRDEGMKGISRTKKLLSFLRRGGSRFG